MPPARKGSRLRGTGQSAGPPNTSQFSRGICPNQFRFGQNARVENTWGTPFGRRPSTGPAPGPGPVSQVVVSIPCQNSFQVAGSSEREASCTKACGGPLPGPVRWTGPAPRTGHETSPFPTALGIQGPVHWGLHLGNPESAPRLPLPLRHKPCLSTLRRSLRGRETFLPQLRSFTRLGARATRQAEADDRPQPVPQLCTGNAPLGRDPRLGRVIWVRFTGAVTGP